MYKAEGSGAMIQGEESSQEVESGERVSQRTNERGQWCM